MATTPEWGLPVAPATAGLLAAYRGELLRWNRQINLVSRRDPEGTATALIGQCAEAFGLWWEASGAALAGGAAGGGRAPGGGALRVFDLGSGGGLPALVWLALLAERGVAARATLVEPRQKRAWFLERLRRLPGAPAYEVVAAPWGADDAGDGAAAGRADATAPDATPILFTLKALRLTESEVLAPLPGALADARVAAGRIVEIVRFQPGEGVDAGGLARDLGIPEPGAAVTWGGTTWGPEGHALLRPGPGGAARAGVAAAALLVSRHRALTDGGPPGC